MKFIVGQLFRKKWLVQRIHLQLSPCSYSCFNVKFWILQYKLSHINDVNEHFKVLIIPYNWKGSVNFISFIFDKWESVDVREIFSVLNLLSQSDCVTTLDVLNSIKTNKLQLRLYDWSIFAGSHAKGERPACSSLGQVWNHSTLW